MNVDISIEEKLILHAALKKQRASTSRQRAITERDLMKCADGTYSDIDVCRRIARFEELELAAIDGLLSKLSYIGGL